MKYASIFLVFASLLLSSCKEIDKFTQFEMEFDQTVTVPANTVLDIPFTVSTPEIESHSSSTFSANDTRKDKIEEIVLTELTLDLQTPSDEDFSFLESIHIYIDAAGLEEKEVAGLDEVPASAGASLSLNVTGLDLKEYIKQDEFSMRMSCVTDEMIQEDHVIDVHSVFFVDAKVLGQ